MSNLNNVRHFLIIFFFISFVFLKNNKINSLTGQSKFNLGLSQAKIQSEKYVFFLINPEGKMAS